MWRTVGRHLLRFLLLLFLGSLAIFGLLRILPGNPAEIALGVTATEENVAELSAQLGTDRPLHQQYLDWVSGMLRGDFGTSLSSGQEITPLLLDRGAVSLILCLSSLFLALLIAVPLGMAATRRRWGTAISVLSQVGIAVPSFLAAVLLVMVFSLHLGWLPANGWIPPGEDFGGFLSRLILPVLALTVVQASILTRYVRSALLEVLEQDFMRTAYATGQGRGEALLSHALRNAAIPVLTVTGLQLTSLIVGAVVIEQVFVIPGLGSLLLSAVSSRDLLMVQAIVMVLVFFTLLVNLIVDVTTTLIDPRLRAGDLPRRNSQTTQADQAAQATTPESPQNDEGGVAKPSAEGAPA
ncbi:ABC transporter permease [Corynebacterium lowii]|uniref:Glutathione transport system permease protein GsiC n=1 Tax=Corynebacterium lowii TaxID=1544413 RepID=A0A0Q1E2S4_9CORY|nr:ABC transporter permease [Corynebacterium lowii]KQB86900.1 Glutathione transport system permease protein GsiC [Corynebacterium lowii]MDP9851588.1 peptide/nickel transport system permease protein [Corynebacterium lowii]